MLDRLDEVNWQDLNHAYGPATDVPAQLRVLESDDAEERREALHSLYGNIWHQGTVYQATAYAVPFLRELALEPSVKGRPDLLRLLADLAGGNSYLVVHRPLIEDGMTASEKADRAADLDRQMGEELDWVRAARDAVAEGKADYLSLLEGAEAREESAESSALRAAAAYTLAACGAASATPRLRAQALVERDPAVRASALLAMACLSPAGDPNAVRFLRGFLGPNYAAVVRAAAAMGVARLAGEAAGGDVVPVLRETLGPAWGEWETLPWAEESDLRGVCGWLAGSPKARRQLLLGLLGDPDARVRAASLFALRGRPIVVPARELVFRVAAMVGDPATEVRQGALWLLKDVGPARDGALPQVLAALTDPSPSVRKAAVGALCKSRSPDALATLLRLLDEQPPGEEVVRAVGGFGPAAASAVPRLIELLSNAKGNVQVLAAVALGQIGESARSAVAALTRALEVPGGISPRRAAAAALGQLGPHAAGAVWALHDLLDRGDVYDRCNAAVALWRITASPERSVGGLGGIPSAGPPTHTRAAECLGQIGPAAGAAVPPLRALLEDSNFWARVRAAEALWRIARDCQRVARAGCGTAPGPGERGSRGVSGRDGTGSRRGDGGSAGGTGLRRAITVGGRRRRRYLPRAARAGRPTNRRSGGRINRGEGLPRLLTSEPYPAPGRRDSDMKYGPRAYERLWLSMRRAAGAAPDAPLAQDTAVPGDLPCPWTTWTLVGLFRHRRRQLWVGRVVTDRLRGDVGRIAAAGAMGHPDDRPQLGVVPGLEEWEYYFHGRGCCLTHRLTGEAIDVDFVGDSAEFFDPFFYLNYLESLKAPPGPERRLIELHPSLEPIRLAFDRLREDGLLVCDGGRKAPRLSPAALAHEPTVDAFCDAWGDEARRPHLAAGIGDWLAVEGMARVGVEERPPALSAGRPDRVRRERAAELIRGFEAGADAGLRLQGLADLGAAELPGLLVRSMRGEVPGTTTVALKIVAAREDAAAWCPEVYRLFVRLDPDGPVPQPYLWTKAAAFLLRQGHRVADVAAALPGAGRRGLGEAALLALEHAPALARVLFRRALRSDVPADRCTAAAALALIDRPWCRAELLAVLDESEAQEPTSECRAALTECRDPAAWRAVEAWEARNPREPEAGPWITMREMSLRRASEWLPYEMDQLRGRVSPLAGREPPDAGV